MYKYLFIGDTKMQWYVILGYVAVVPLVLFNLIRCKEKRENYSVLFQRSRLFFVKKIRQHSPLRFLQKDGFWVILEILLLCAIQYVPAIYLNPGFARLFNTGANYFGFLLVSPIIMYFAYWLFGIKPLQQSDLITPSYPLALIIVKLACFCQGCCKGIECSFGMYNYTTGAVEFPVQLVEIAEALFLFIFLFCIRKKVKPGTLMPLYTILYSALRFCSEFLRAEENVLGPLKAFHLFCIAGILIGCVEYFIVVRYGDAITRLVAPGLYTLVADCKKKKAQLKKEKQKNKKAAGARKK